MSIDKNLLQNLRVDINEAMRAIIEKHGLTSLSAGNCSYTAMGSFTFKLEGVVGDGIDKRAALYDSLRTEYPALPSRGTAFDAGSKSYKIVGANTTGTKIVGELGGKTFLFKTSDIVRYFENKLSKATKK